MSYVKFVGLKTPNEVLAKIADYVTGQGYIIKQPLVDDLDIYTKSNTDGKKFCFMDATETYYIMLRSANGYNIFGTNDDAAMDNTTPVTGSNYTGIGMTVGEGYSSTQRWYQQFRVPKAYNNSVRYFKEQDVGVVPNGVNPNGSTKYKNYPVDVLGVWMPMKVGKYYSYSAYKEEDARSYTLYCNRVKTPTDTLVFSIVQEDDSYRQTAHLIVGNVKKFGNPLAEADEDEDGDPMWTGGIYFSGSASRYMMPTAVDVFDHTVTSDSVILPILSSSTRSNTFLRIDIDEAVSEIRGYIRWASSGTDNVTGKKLSLPVRTGTNMNGQIPNYYYLQSKSRLDWGRNINTLNCLTIDMPIYMAVLVDPDSIGEYAAVGLVSGIYYVSTLNMQTGFDYERDYPNSARRAQVFSYGKRRGTYGFDGFSVRQELDADNDDDNG